MKNISQLVGLSFWDRLVVRLRSFSDLLSYIGVGVLSLLLSTSVLFAQISPFGVAFVAAMGKDFTLPAVLGGILGCLLAPGVDFKMKYVAALLLVGAVRFAFGGRQRLRFGTVLPPVLAGVALAGAGAATIMAGGAGNATYRVILLLCEVLISAGAAFFFTRTLGLLDRKDTAPLRQNDVSCTIITFGLLVVALCSFTVAQVSLGRVAAALVVLICALKAGEAGGAVGGVTAGVAVCLYDYSYAFLMGSYGFGGLMAGVFGGFGRFGCACAFIVVNGIATALAALVRPTTIGPVIEVFIASVIFVLLPQGLLSKLSIAPGRSNTLSAESIKGILLNRLHTTRTALSDVCDITDKVALKLQKLEAPPFDVCEETAGRVCKSCKNRISCWGEGYSTTSAALADLCSLLRRGKTISESDLPEHMRELCPTAGALTAALCSCYEEQRRQELRFTRNVQLRSIVLDQWSGIEQLIAGIAEDISRVSVVNDALCARIHEYFSRRGISPLVLSCYENAGGHVVIELTVSAAVSSAIDRTELCFDLSELCERDLSLPELCEHGSRVFLKLCECPGFRLQHGVTQITASGRRLCGDSFKFLDEPGGVALAILSDGMGSGSLAAIDSSMAASLIARLSVAGASPKAALKLVNSAMLIKSGDESLATVDICRADLYRGSVTFYKAGAAPSYVKKSGRVGFIESSSLPAGILNCVEFEETTISLSNGDILLLVSDGVAPTGEEWILDELERYTGTDMQMLCERIAGMAQLRHREERDDDITVCAMMMSEV